ncbi:coatamer subunit protein [Aspergillus sclerotiicarbonarius CBS 121057]|uniref:Coatamer subunit protein n=1 Tax=Aspergillus sclerotiicarbonarius (strain CBS 121057 / IBT 28362) TaxID=1448318 RepID=A0A319E755_ASPSB|nr:coatamer subunit protein [Aspergillus sclerotiicarbonarius CBS 121057]
MSDESKPKGFPDISAKLSAIPKKSLFERQKAEAEAKRAREQAETAAVYEDFVKSFEDDSHGPDRHSGDGRLSRFPPKNPGFGGGPGRRHFTSSGPRMSGPGTLGPSPSSLSRKRPHEGFQPLHRNRDTAQGILGFDNTAPSSAAAASAFRASDDEDEGAGDAKEAERAAAKPTLYLASLPPGTSPSVLKSLIPSVLTVDNVKILRPPGQPITDRKSVAAIVTLANESAASDIDSTVSALQNRYLGWGYYLTISRHLSSAAIGSTMPVTVGLSSTCSLPFGAKSIAPDIPGRLNRAPPPGLHRGGFAPPSSYGSAHGRGGPSTQVEVKAPSDLKQLKLIHKTLENLLNYGPEFEALLMSRPEVQREEKWAWLWNARSAGGVYYRWKLWEILTNNRPVASRRGRPQTSSTIFEGGANWVPLEAHIKFEYTTRMDEFVTDDDYDSSDEEMSDYEEERRNLGGAPPAEGPGANNEGLGYMNPLQKAKLTHLLARLPTTHAKLRKGDVARVTAFAIEHAGAGADEVVEMIVSNIINPFAYTGANPDREAEKGLARREQAGDLANDNPAEEGRSSMKETLDLSSAKLVGLYLVSDILSSSATSGVRHAWRYRQLFESALKTHQVFEHLGRLEKDLSWGRLRAEKWKRSVGSLLHLWEGWCVFPQSSQEHFFQIFEKPPLTEVELREEREKAEAERAASAFSKNKSRWKTVDEDASSGKFDPGRAPETDPHRMDVDQENVASAGAEDFDGESMSDIDGEPMEDSDLEVPDGEPLEEETPEDDSGLKEQPEKFGAEPSAQPEPQPPARKPRPRAEDMFADSDSD